MKGEMFQTALSNFMVVGEICGTLNCMLHSQTGKYSGKRVRL